MDYAWDGAGHVVGGGCCGGDVWQGRVWFGMLSVGVGYSAGMVGVIGDVGAVVL